MLFVVLFCFVRFYRVGLFVYLNCFVVVVVLYLFFCGLFLYACVDCVLLFVCI